MITAMTETPEPRTEPTAATTEPRAVEERPRDRYDRRSRLSTVLAWVGIIAGVVFIVAVVFFSGFALGAHSGGHGGWQHHRHGDAMFHRGGPRPMGPWQYPGGPMGPGQMGPGGPMGPGGTPSPTPTAPPAPSRP